MPGAHSEPVFPPLTFMAAASGKSAIDAVLLRQRCWRCDWVLDLDVRAY